MGARRIAAAAVASGLVLGTAVIGAPAAVAAPAPKYVGIVIQGSGSGCVKWHRGITGDEVLNAVARVRYRQDGLIVQINGAPASAKADTDHYWEYWRATASSWAYSSTGASGTSPAAGSVEGWAFTTDGSRRSPSVAASGLYRSLCGARDATSAPAPKSSAKSSAAPPRTASSAARPASRASVSAPAVGRASAGATSAGASAGSPAPRRAVTAPSSTPSAAVPVTPSATRPSSPVTGAGSAVFSPAVPGGASASPVSATTDATGGGSLLPVVLVAGLVVVLGGGAGLTVLRRRRSDAEL